MALSNNEVYTVIQDRKGYIWFATGDGIDRYDGYVFKIFRHDPNDPGSLSGSFVRALYEDPEGRIWVGTFSDGLNLYDPNTGSFKHYRHIAGDSNSLISDDIWSLHSAPDGRLLIGTRDSGLDIFDSKTGRFQHFTAGSGPDAPSNNRIQNIFVDSQANVWLATSAGLDEFDPTGKNPVRHFRVPNSKDSSATISIAEDKEHRLWLATLAGAYIYTPGDAALSDIPGIAKKKNLMAGVPLYSVFIDAQQNVWYGGQQDGLYLVRNNSHEVMHYQHQNGNSESLASNLVTDIFQDRAGYIWVTTNSGTSMLDPDALDVYSLKPSDIAGSRADISDSVSALQEFHGNLLLAGVDGIYRYHLASTDGRLKDSSNLFAHLDPKKYGGATAIAVTDEQVLLVGTGFGYLLSIDARGRITHTWRPGIDMGLKSRTIRRILPVNGREVYLATFSTGLLDLDLETSKTKRIGGSSSVELAPEDIVEDLLPTASGKLWVATFRGLFEIDTNTNHSNLVPMIPGNIEPVVQGLYEDGKRNLWITTYEGLWRLKLDDAGNPVAHPEAIPQFRHLQMLAIEPGSQGELWLASVNSLIRFNPTTGETLTFGRDQGSPMSEYYSYGHTRTSDGWLWFGGGQGAVGFLPQNLRPNLHIPGVVLDGVTAYREGKPSYTSLASNKYLVLNYQDVISIFDVVAMDYGAPQANTYSYRLIGFQSQWTPPSSSHLITFTNLNPGRYRLEVKAANNWGTWSATPATLDIVVLPALVAHLVGVRPLLSNHHRQQHRLCLQPETQDRA